MLLKLISVFLESSTADSRYAVGKALHSGLPFRCTNKSCRAKAHDIQSLNKAAGEDRMRYDFFINASDEFLNEMVMSI